MTHAGIQMFVEKLKHLINCDDPLITCERSQLQPLYEELGSMIQTLFINQYQDLYEQMENFKDLKKRFIDAAEKAQYRVDLFLSGAHLRNNGHFPPTEDFKPSLNLDEVTTSFDSINVEFISITIDNMKLDSSRKLNQSAAAVAAPRISLRSKDEIIVGIDDDAKLIKDSLLVDQKELDVVSIVGMGGIGKTTLATKVFNDPFVVYHFEIRAWVTLSQTYDKRGVLIQILKSIRGQVELEDVSDSSLRDMVRKDLMVKRYLIVIDDIWHIETWDKVKLFFPHDNTGSRIMLTTRLTEVAKHATSDGLVHHLGYLNKETSWELLCKKVFYDINECPEWSIKPGMQIVENCKGLPLSVVVIAGVLAKETWSEKLWVEIAERTGSHIVDDENGCLEILALSYNHLPFHMRKCFVYLGGFPEDHTFVAQRLIWLWVAEGFIQQAENESLEDIAENYLMDLIERNLINISDKRKSNGDVKACKLHDLVRELCLSKAREEEIILQVQSPILSSQFSTVITPPYKPVRMFLNKDTNIQFPSAQNLRSILFLSDFRPLTDFFAKYFRTFALLRALDLQRCSLDDFPKGMELLVHLRYLAIWKKSPGFPSSICKLWGLRTLIYKTRQNTTVLPSNISDMVNLRYLWSYLPSSVGIRSFKMPFFIDSIDKPMNLRAISNVVLSDKVGNFQKCFPCIKELTCSTYADEECDFESLTCLEKLKLTDYRPRMNCNTYCITFPATLRALTLVSCGLPWSHMPIIQSLPNLQVLKLRLGAFEGSCWITDKAQEFPQLTFLRLEVLNIEEWVACDTSFPCLRQLEIYSCKDLNGIPSEIGEIPTLELIRIDDCSDSVNESVRMIQEEQNDLGNYDLKIEFKRKL